MVTLQCFISKPNYYLNQHKLRRKRRCQFSLNNFYFFKNNWRKLLAISVQLCFYSLDLVKTLYDELDWEMLLPRSAPKTEKNKSVSPQASFGFLRVFPKKILYASLLSPLSLGFVFQIPFPVWHCQSRGTLEILPFSKDCVFDCINKLWRHPVDPILRSFCRTKLECLKIERKKKVV